MVRNEEDGGWVGGLDTEAARGVWPLVGVGFGNEFGKFHLHVQNAKLHVQNVTLHVQYKPLLLQNHF